MMLQLSCKLNMNIHPVTMKSFVHIRESHYTINFRQFHKHYSLKWNDIDMKHFTYKAGHIFEK